MEVVLLYAALLDADFKAEHRAVAVDDRTLNLVLRAAHIDDRTDVAGNDDFVEREFLVFVYADLGHFREVTGMAVVERQAQAATRRKFLSPSALFRGELNDRRHAACVERAFVLWVDETRIAHEFKQHFEVIASGRHRELVDERLRDKSKRIRSRRTPWAAGCTHVDFGLHHTEIRKERSRRFRSIHPTAADGAT